MKILYVNSGIIFTSALYVNSFAQLVRPNIVLIVTDDQRAGTIHALGNYEVITPNMDQLVKNGISFTNAYIMGSNSSAVSMPSRACLLTGKDIKNLKKDGEIIPSTDTLLGEMLQKNGYLTFGTGKYHNQPESFSRCFAKGNAIFFGGMCDPWNVPLCYYENKYGKNNRPVIKNFTEFNNISYLQGDYCIGGNHATEIFTQALINFIDSCQSEKPFFAYIAYTSPHDPRSTYSKYYQMYDTSKIEVPSNFLSKHPFDIGDMDVRDELLAKTPRTIEEIKQHIKDYYACISHIDEKIGEIVETLKNKGVYENTIIILTSDNGIAIGQHGLMGKQNLYECSTHIPLVISGKVPIKNTQSDILLYLSDLFPTICDLIEIPIPKSVDGNSFYPVFKNKTYIHREWITTKYKNYQKAVRDNNFKLIQYTVKDSKTFQLFDLNNDAMEVNNLYDNPKYKHIVQTLSLKLR